MNDKPTNKVYTKGVKRYRKWLKHLHGEGAHIFYRESREGMHQAFLIRASSHDQLKQIRFVPLRMAEQIWERRRDK